MDVIVLDGNQRSTLATVRSLGKKGIEIAVGEEEFPSLSSSSRYCSYGFSYPSPYTNSESFIKKIQEISAQNPGAMLLPMTDVTLSEVLKNKAYLSDYVKIPFADYDNYTAASDKVRIFRLAKDLNIPIPKTLFSSDFKTLKDIVAESRDMRYPLVLKPTRSRIRAQHGWMNVGICYAKNSTELQEILDDEPFQSWPFLIQERIEGPGVGIFLLMKECRVIARFAHKRIREKPPSGGVSVLCQSVWPPPEALDAAKRLLEALAWTGVAMVEFKWDTRDNMPKLMEVNARFWGSLQLAICAGVDFPYLLYCIAKGKKVSPPDHYGVGIKSRWELGDLDHLLIRLRRKTCALNLPPDAPSKRMILVDFILDFFRPSVRNEVIKSDDPRPFLFEINQYIRNLIS